MKEAPLSLLACGAALWMAALAPVHAAASDRLPLIAKGEPQAIVVVPKNQTTPVRDRARAFIDMVKRSTGVELPLYTDDREAEFPAGKTRLFLEECEQTRAAGLSLADLPEEGYRIEPRGESVFILGKTAGPSLRPGSSKDPWYSSDPLRWALNHILEQEAGVRWIWPGDLGTYVPRKETLSLPVEPVAYQPQLKMRQLVVATMRSPEDAGIRAEALEWVANHQGGERGGVVMKHAFNHWWEKYHAEHPGFFAQPPPGEEQRKQGYVKLAMGNPEVLELIAKEYLAAGKPRYWSVTPNDGIGFDVSDAARALDLPQNLPPLEIWRGQVNLTPRYVAWWNQIYERLAEINSEVILSTMAYSAYRMPPPLERPLKAKALIGIVPSYRAYHVWGGWAKYADELVLRPNWGHYGANGPHLALHESAGYIQYAAAHKMVGFYLDSILGFWGTQGMNYYLWARLMVDPQRPVDAIVDEYVEAFGDGAPKVKEYLYYWEEVTSEWAHGHKLHKVPEGWYDALIRENKIRDNPLIGPRDAIPYIYTDEVLAKGYSLLNEAAALIGQNDPEALARVEFLRNGLDELKLTRDCLALGSKAEKTRDSGVIKELTAKAREHAELRKKLSPSHAIWSTVATSREDRVKIKMRPENLSFKTDSGEEDF